MAAQIEKKIYGSDTVKIKIVLMGVLIYLLVHGAPCAQTHKWIRVGDDGVPNVINFVADTLQGK